MGRGNGVASIAGMGKTLKVPALSNSQGSVIKQRQGSEMALLFLLFISFGNHQLSSQLAISHK
jgi:hypothetical protein